MTKIVKKITSCGDCPFFEAEDGLKLCGHPYWDQFDDVLHIRGKDFYYDKVPDECPLKIEDLTIDYKLGTEK